MNTTSPLPLVVTQQSMLPVISLGPLPQPQPLSSLQAPIPLIPVQLYSIFKPPHVIAMKHFSGAAQQQVPSLRQQMLSNMGGKIGMIDRHLQALEKKDFPPSVVLKTLGEDIDDMISDLASMKAEINNFLPEPHREVRNQSLQQIMTSTSAPFKQPNFAAPHQQQYPRMQDKDASFSFEPLSTANPGRSNVSVRSVLEGRPAVAPRITSASGSDIRSIAPKTVSLLAGPFAGHGNLQLHGSGYESQPAHHCFNPSKNEQGNRRLRQNDDRTVRHRHMIRKDEKEYLERRYRENPFVWDASNTEEISIFLGISRKKITQWRYVRSRKDPQLVVYQRQKRARRQQRLQRQVAHSLAQGKSGVRDSTSSMPAITAITAKFSSPGSQKENQ